MNIEPRKLAAILAAIERYRAEQGPAPGPRPGAAWRRAGRRELMGLKGERDDQPDRFRQGRA